MGNLLNPYRFAAPAAFTPADLFGVGDVGGYGDINPDTTNVAVDNAVAQADDESGNANHMVQATAAKQPILREVGTSGVYYLENDGVDDFMELLGFNGADLTVFTLAIATHYVSKTSGDSEDKTRSYGLGSSGVDGAQSSTIHFNPAADASLRFDGNFQAGTLTITEAADLVRVSQRNGTTVGDWIDGSENIAPGTDPGTLLDTVDNLYMPPFVNGGSLPQTRSYAWFVIDRILTDAERGDLEAWLADKQGRTL